MEKIVRPDTPVHITTLLSLLPIRLFKLCNNSAVTFLPSTLLHVYLPIYPIKCVQIRFNFPHSHGFLLTGELLLGKEAHKLHLRGADCREYPLSMFPPCYVTLNRGRVYSPCEISSLFYG